MKLEIDVVCQFPYRLRLELSETDLAALQDMLSEVARRPNQFSDHQRDLAGEIAGRISQVWLE
jgi:hypothetical protein